jgi:hypothetical protein
MVNLQDNARAIMRATMRARYNESSNQVRVEPTKQKEKFSWRKTNFIGRSM